MYLFIFITWHFIIGDRIYVFGSNNYDIRENRFFSSPAQDFYYFEFFFFNF